MLKYFSIVCETWTIKRKQMDKMNDWLPEERLSTSRLIHNFLKIYLYGPTPKFQKEEIDSDSTIMQSKIKICKISKKMRDQ